MRIHRHRYRVSGVYVPHAQCLTCGKISFNPRWPWWKERK